MVVDKNMSTVKVYQRCKNCNSIVTIVTSDTEKLSNLMLCPVCDRNMMAKRKMKRSK